MVFLGPVSIHHVSGFTPKRSAYFRSAGTESRSGSTVKERKCTNAVSVLRRSSLSLSAFCSFFILRESVGQIEGQWVKKKSATSTRPFNSSSETCFPNWLVSTTLLTLCQTVSSTCLPFFVVVITVSK